MKNKISVVPSSRCQCQGSEISNLLLWRIFSNKNRLTQTYAQKIFLNRQKKKIIEKIIYDNLFFLENKLLNDQIFTCGWVPAPGWRGPPPAWRQHWLSSSVPRTPGFASAPRPWLSSPRRWGVAVPPAFVFIYYLLYFYLLPYLFLYFYLLSWPRRSAAVIWPAFIFIHLFYLRSYLFLYYVIYFYLLPYLFIFIYCHGLADQQQ